LFHYDLLLDRGMGDEGLWFRRSVAIQVRDPAVPKKIKGSR
jgi:hypothetical protein